MNASLAFVLPSSLTRFVWDWDWHSHHSGRDAEFDATLAWLVTLLATGLAFGAGFLLGGLLHGGLLLALTGRKRYLPWVVPAVNAGLYFPVRAYLLPAEGPLAYAPLGLLLALLGGLLAAALLAPLHVLWRRSRGEAQAVTEREASPLPEWELLPPDEPKSTAFWRGVMAPWEGFGYLCQRPRLLWYGVIPVALNLLISGAVLVLLLASVAAFVAYLHPLFPSGWGWVLLEILCGVLLLLLAMGLALALWTLLQGVLCGHYQTKLARAVEIQLGMKPEEMQEVSWGYQIADAFRDTAALIAINGGFLLLHLVPVVGSIAGTLGSLYFDMLLFGADYFDHPLELRGKRRDEKKEFVRRHRYQTLGLGAVVFGANFVPVVGPVVLTTAVVGAVLLHRRLEAVQGPR